MQGKKQRNPLKIIGIILIIIGAFMMFLAFPTQPFNIVSIGTPVASIQADIPPFNLTRLIVGLVISIFGLFLYLSENLLKALKDRRR